MDTESVTDETQDDDDTREACHQHNDRRCQGEQRHEEKQLDGDTEVTRAIETANI